MTTYEKMTVKDLIGICKGNPKYAGYSPMVCSKDALINFMRECERKAPATAKTGYEAMTYKQLISLCKGNPKYAGYTRYVHSKTLLFAYIRDCNKRAAKNIEEKIEQPAPTAKPVDSLPAPAAGGENSGMDEKPAAKIKRLTVPAALTHIKVTPEEYLDDVAMPAPFWSCQITNSLTWGRWRFGEGESKAQGKYLSIACSELCRHWVILWDWKSFESACKELIYGLTRLGEAAFLPSPGYLPAPPAEDEEPADDKDDGHRGGDPRRERQSKHHEPDSQHCEPDSEHYEPDSEHYEPDSEHYELNSEHLMGVPA